ncbi:MAG: BON domain-containing protein [Bacteroidota bacterium]
MAKQDLEHALREALNHDPSIETTRLRITLLEDTVALEGEVSNLHAKARAGAIALALVPFLQVDNSLVVAVNRPPHDSELTRLAQEALAKDPMLTKDLGVRVHDGIASLVGTAETLEEVMRASDILAHIPGIRSIHREAGLREKVRVPETDAFYDVDDQSIISAIALRVGKLEDTLPRRITIRADNGTVFLYGMVPTGCDRLRIEREAFRVAGVHRVHNNLETLDGTTGGNEALERMIRDKLGKKGDDATTGYIGVMVEDDTAFLFGFADYPEGKEQAGKIARETPGIRNVVNDIQMQDKQKA